MELTQFTNIEAEQAILGTIIINNDYLRRVEDMLNRKHFYELAHQEIYDKILSFKMEGIGSNQISLKVFCESDPAIKKIGGALYLSTLLNCASSIIDIRDYAFILIELAEKRKLVAGFHEMIVLLETKTTSDVVAKTQDLIASVDSESSEVEIFDGEQMEQALLDGWKDGSSNIIIPTGINKLDVMLNGGFTVDKLYTIGAAPGTGKTSLAQQVILNALKKEYGVLFVSMEMERKNIFARFLASFSSINPFRIVINNIFKHELDKFDNALKEWNKLKPNYFMTEKGHLTLKQIENALKRKLKASPIKLMVVDYIQIMQLRDAKNMNEASLIKENVNGLKDLATKYHVSVVALSQLTKDNLGGKPGLKALKGSGGIAEDSHCVINLWTDSEDDSQKSNKLVNVEVAKNRNGPLGNLVVNFDGEFNRFTENNNF
jgi:replicative DNA helicase